MPVILLRLLWRGLRSRGYWRRWPERFGIFPQRASNSIWLHAVSVGETVAATPLIEALLKRYPKQTIVVTTTTPTGSDRVIAAFGNRVLHVYAPYDSPGAVKRFLRRVNPTLAIVMETELWPNLFFFCHQRNISLIVANARLSERSLRGYLRFSSLLAQTLKCVRVIAAQTQADAERFRQLGADEKQLRVMGNIKFDLRLPENLQERAAALRQSWGTDRPVWIAASTREGEEAIILDAFDRVRSKVPNALLVLVPRHPERFRLAVELSQKRGFNVAQRSQQAMLELGTNVFIGDTMGELLLLYAASDVAFVGGSLVPVGGHNVLEPAALGLPILVGPHTFNFDAVTAQLINAGSAQRVEGAQDLGDRLISLLRDVAQSKQVGEPGRRLIEANRGAMERLLLLIEENS